MNIVTSIRSRLNRVVGAAIGAFFFITCGAVLAFVISPQQALQARRIERLPHMTAEDVAVATPGDDVLVTGRLEDNPVIARDQFVDYTREVWQVTVPTPGDQSGSQSNDASGKWETVERVVPDLVLNVNDRRIDILQAGSVRLSGPLHESLVRGYSSRKATYNGEMLAQGSERVRGFHNGDLTTVLGAKASTGGVIPEELFAGDRMAFSQYKKDAARGMFIFGLCMMGMAPVVLGGGVLSALLGRWRR
jgi:hypothetical protein